MIRVTCRSWDLVLWKLNSDGWIMWSDTKECTFVAFPEAQDLAHRNIHITVPFPCLPPEA